MYPLIHKDGDTIPYVSLVYLLFLPLASSLASPKSTNSHAALVYVPFLFKVLGYPPTI